MELELVEVKTYYVDGNCARPNPAEVFSRRSGAFSIWT